MPQKGKFTLANGITQLTGDVTAGPGNGSQVATLSGTGISAGTYGDATHIPQIVFDAKGRATSATNVAMAGISSSAASNVGTFGSSTQVAQVTVDGFGRVTNAANVGINGISSSIGPVGTYGSGILIPQITVDAFGRVTAVSNVSVSASSASTGLSTYTSPMSSQPSSPVSGDIWFPSDGIDIRRYSGSTFVPWGPIFPLTDPAIGGPSTWVNQGGATVDTTHGGSYLLAPAGAGDNIRMLVKTASTSGYTVTALFAVHRPNINFAAAGLCWRESGSSKVVTFSFVHDTVTFTATSLGVQKFTNPTTFSANYGGNMNIPAGYYLWMQITDNLTNRIARWGVDGQFWHQVHSVGRTDFLTADQVGFFANCAQATWPVGIHLLSWRES